MSVVVKVVPLASTKKILLTPIGVILYSRTHGIHLLSLKIIFLYNNLFLVLPYNKFMFTTFSLLILSSHDKITLTLWVDLARNGGHLLEEQLLSKHVVLSSKVKVITYVVRFTNHLLLF